MTQKLRRYTVELSVLMVGLGLRLALLRPAYVPAEVDELEYAADGLLLLEGATPGFKFAPAAVTTWVGFMYGAAQWFFNSVKALNSELDWLVLPLVTLDQTLFDIYSDMTGLYVAIIVVVLCISLLGVYSAARIGRHFADWPGALLAGGLAAVVPQLNLFAVQSRPYAPAWSLSILSISIILTFEGSRRWTWAGIIFGLAVASRVEMLLIVPLIVWAMWVVSYNQDRVRSGARMAAAAILTFLVSAPWFISHLIGNLRKVITVATLRQGLDKPTPVEELMLNEGLAIVAVMTIVGVACLCRTDRWKAWVAMGYLLLLGLGLSTITTSGGLRHAGYAFVIVIVFSAYALRAIQHVLNRRQAILISAGAALLSIALPLGLSVSMIRDVRSSWVRNNTVEWIESNVPSGARVFLTRSLVKVPLPTEASSNRLWGEAARDTAWSEKLEGRLGDIGVDLDYLPRGLSLEHMYQELAGLRRYYILGTPREQSRPRYDLRLVQTTSEFQDALDEFLKEGGVFWHAGQPLDRELGPARQAWSTADGTGVFLYTRPEPLSSNLGVN